MLSIGCAGTNILNSSAGAGTARGGSQRSVSHSRLEAPSSKYNNNRATVTPGAVQNHQYANADSKHRRLLEGNNFSSNSTNLHCSSAYLQQPGQSMDKGNAVLSSSSLESLKVHHQVPSSSSVSTASNFTIKNNNLFQPTSNSQKQHQPKQVQPDSSNSNRANNSSNNSTTSYPSLVVSRNNTSLRTGVQQQVDSVGGAGSAKTGQESLNHFTASGDEIIHLGAVNPFSLLANVDKVGTSIVAQEKRRSADEEGDHGVLSLGSETGTVDQQASGNLALASQVSSALDRVLRDAVFDSLFVSCKRHADKNPAAIGDNKKDFIFQLFDPFKSLPMPASTDLIHTSDSWGIQTLQNPNQFLRPSFLPMEDAEAFDINEVADETLRSVSQQSAKDSLKSNNDSNFGPTTPVKTFRGFKVNAAISLGSSEPALSSPRAQNASPSFNYLSSRPSDSVESSDRNNGSTTNFPPSPPLARKHAVHAGSPTMLGTGNHEKYVELLTQYNTLKKQLVDLEDKVKVVHGQRIAEKEVNKLPEYKTLMSQISKTRNQLKEWKSGDHSENFFAWTSESMKENVRESGVDVAKLQHMKEVMLTATERLADKRREANRPYEISQMSEVDIKIEKEQTQKELLNFEKLFGRVKMKEERQIAGDLYDRYRALKKLSKSTHYTKSTTPSTVDSDINSDFGDNSSAGRSPAMAVYLPGATTEAVQSNVSQESSRISRKDLEIERSMLLDRKRKLSKSVNTINRSVSTYKQQADLNELEKVRGRLKQIENALSSMGSSGSSGK